MADYGAAVSQKGYDVKTCADRFLVYSSAFPVLKIFIASATTGEIPSGNDGTFTANASTDYLTSAGHGLSNGDVLNFTSSGTLPAPLQEGEDYLYYVINKTTNTFQVSLTPSGTAVNITNTGSGTHDWWNDVSRISISHNLGYFVPYFIIYNGSTSGGQTNSYFMSDSSFNILTTYNYENRLDIEIGSGFDSANSNPGDTVYFTVYIFLDDFSTISANTINSGTSSGASSTDYGLRISKSGYDVKTCDDINCVMSSSFFTQIIHMKGQASGNVSHGLGYVPSFLSYYEDSDNYGDFIRYFSTQVSSSTLYLSSSNYYIIFKQKND